jgi:hypothetical protein
MTLDVFSTRAIVKDSLSFAIRMYAGTVNPIRVEARKRRSPELTGIY